MTVSSYLTQMWTNFAVNGNPGLGNVPWNNTHKKYMKVVVNIECFLTHSFRSLMSFSFSPTIVRNTILLLIRLTITTTTRTLVLIQ